MDLSYGSAMEEFRSEVSDFLADNWPPTGDEAKYSQADQATRFRKRAIDRGFLCRNIPKKYGGSEQPTDGIEMSIIESGERRTASVKDCIKVMMASKVPAGSRSTPYRLRA